MPPYRTTGIDDRIEACQLLRLPLVSAPGPSSGAAARKRRGPCATAGCARKDVVLGSLRLRAR